jgi:DNA-binding transcriptional MerR regulator
MRFYSIDYVETHRMKRPALSDSVQAQRPETPLRGRAAKGGLLAENEVDEIERASPEGLTSRQIVDVFETRGIRFSEATLRKYVQLGLLPRSIRVGRKGKHRGSCGLYPAHVIRRVNAVKGMMAEDRTIEEIQRSFARFKDDIDAMEKDLRALIGGFEREAKAPTVDPSGRRELEREITEARRAASELVRRITSLEQRFSSRAAESSAAGAAIGGGSDLY